MSDNGFDNYKLLYEERFRVNEAKHDATLAKLTAIEQRLSELDSKLTRHSAWWGAFGAGIVLVINFLTPVLIGGCS